LNGLLIEHYRLRLARDDDRGSLKSAPVPGTLVALKEPSTGSKADIGPPFTVVSVFTGMAFIDVSAVHL
jgi:hypothetical protein